MGARRQRPILLCCLIPEIARLTRVWKLKIDFFVYCTNKYEMRALFSGAGASGPPSTERTARARAPQLQV